jgi:ubiquinone/menaquinone biosynthesis C-methylase UbiE
VTRAVAATDVTWAVAAAYSATGASWQTGPGRIYDRLAEAVLDRSPLTVAGARILDVGAGTGAVSRAAAVAGAARVVAVDAAAGVLAYDIERRPPALVGDARALPFPASSFDLSIAAFSLNHLTDPVDGLREMVRVTGPDGGLLAAAYADDDDHPVKAAVEAALADRGWTPEPWYAALRVDAMPRLATIDGCRTVAAAAGLRASVERVRVGFPELAIGDLIAWRFGMAQHAPFVARLSAAERDDVSEQVVTRCANSGGLVRSILVLSARRR